MTVALKKMKNKKIAQAASELAIFGAILLFLIGGIIRVGFQQGQSMDISLRAMRLALSESWRTAQGRYTAGGISIARNNSSVYVVEDRLSVDAGQKFGTRDRSPLLAVGQGTLTQNLMYSFDWDLEQDIPVSDYIINGQRFPFSVGAFRTISGTDLSADPSVSSIPLCNTGTTTVFINNSQRARCIEPQCYDTGLAGAPVWNPCVIFFRRVYNCSTCEFDKDTTYGFDLNFDGTLDFDTGNLPNGWIQNADKYAEYFGWQWQGVIGAREEMSFNPTLDGMPLLTDMQERDTINIDGDDLQEETFFRAQYDAVTDLVSEIDYLDSQEGDTDPTFTATSFDDQQGLQPDAQMFSYTYPKPHGASGPNQQGTYYRIEDGKLYSTNGTYVRNTTRQDHVDIVSRVFRLSNNTGRFCKERVGGSGLWEPRTWTGPTNLNDPDSTHPVVGVQDMTNPVEVCVPSAVSTNCFDANTIEKTCMDTATLTIFIRSRLQDIRGERWITQTNTP